MSQTKGAIIKGKNMLPIGSIFFPLKVAPMRKENNFEGIKMINCQEYTTPICQSERGTCIKGLIWPPLEPKTENCFSQISFDWFIRRMTEV